MSIATVSSVLSNRHVERRIAAATVQKIQTAARELGYVPNMAGRRLRAHKSATRQFDLAILTSFEAPLPLVGQVLRAMQTAVDAATTEKTNYAVTIEMFHAGRLSEQPSLLNANRYHGVIITNTLPEDDKFLEERIIPFPAVVMGRQLRGYCCVLEAPRYVGRQSAEILTKTGCHAPAIIHGKSLTHTTADRVAAFTEEVKKCLGRDPIVLVSEGLEAGPGGEAVAQFLATGNSLDGLFAVTDSLAIGAYQAIKRHGLSIPGDIKVVGVGDNELSEFFDPPLTTVAGANDAMVAEAIPMLFRMLDKGDGTAQEVHVVPSVYRRESTDT